MAFTLFIVKPDAVGRRLTGKILAKVEGVRFVRFSDRDVVRHPIVQAIVKAYDAAEGRLARNP